MPKLDFQTQQPAQGDQNQPQNYSTCLEDVPQPSAYPRPPKPPITCALLLKLDLKLFIQRHRFRHEINFDPDLRLIPNLSGKEGKKRQDRAEKFWCALKTELARFLANREQFYGPDGRFIDWTLPTLLKTVKEIILILIPQHDHQVLKDGLDTELVMQQLRHGVTDVEKLARWLSSLLKCHCDPVRHDSIDGMYELLSNGNSNSDPEELVKGMERLLGILEMMKLDDANYQLQNHRPAIIEGTILFEYKFFEEMIKSAEIDVSRAKQWYRDAELQFATNRSHFGEMGVFFEAFTRLVLPSSADQCIPNTFCLDTDIIINLRDGILDVINLEVCWRLFQDLQRSHRRSRGHLPTPALDAATSRSCSLTIDFNFNTRLEAGQSPSLDFCAVDCGANSTDSAPTPPAYRATMRNEFSEGNRAFYSPLVSLLESAAPGLHGSARWQSMSSKIALQIFRHIEAPKTRLVDLEKELALNTCNTESPLYREVEKSFHRRLLAVLGTRVRKCRSMSCFALFSAWKQRKKVLRRHNVIKYIAFRLAHLGIVHWRIWSKLAYTTEDSTDQNEA
ncbi:hypothetical protein NQ176_g8526 [Zarea fungicola]|uniref:Uncharacterized protein n=1 Tax=Zarea fungicola TaxID=93591 RepID=A0ACC1MRT5_9HYPO|nr:hypothetical protein NQ176_g8526 [Lecanicillium fungicola]